MIEVELPDGSIAEFPDGTPNDVMKAAIQKRFPVQAPAPTEVAPVAPQVDSGPLLVPTQGMSGVNEGLANFLSLPNTLIGGAEMGLRSIGPAIGNALGGDFAMPSEPLLKLPDAGENYRNIANEMGAIRPETEDGMGRFARRVGQEVGANIIPTTGTPAKLASAVASVGSGIGAATAQQAFPDNPGAELVGQLLGGGVTLGAANVLERGKLAKVAPTIEDLEEKAGALYDAARDSGVTFSKNTVKTAVDEITATALSEGLDPTLHPGAVAALKRLQGAAETGMTAQDAQTIRRVLGAAAKDPMNPDQARIAGQMIRDFDDSITGSIPELGQANALYSKAKKGQLIEDAFTSAKDRLGVNYNNAGMVTALRQEFNKILSSPKKARGLSEAEISSIRDFVRGGPVENVLRTIGRLAPTGPISGATAFGLPATLGYFLGNPVLGAALGIGAAGTGVAARGAGNAIAMNRAKEIAAELLRGGAAQVPAITPNTLNATAATLTGQAANQNNPRDEIARALLN